MTFDEFMRYVRLLANQGWVRYYLNLLPGRMVIEFAIPADCRPERLDIELIDKGFDPIESVYTVGTLYCYRWSVKRDEADVNPLTD